MYLEHKIAIPTVNDLLPEIENDGDNLHGGAESIVENLKRIINKIMELVELIRMYMELMNRLDMLLKDQVNIFEGQIIEKKNICKNCGLILSDEGQHKYKNISKYFWELELGKASNRIS
ncbi:hypothetical protein PV328_003861 [Microctonus aethiopoides]|uniref:Uncharacterized protein n=1 Tax=Microctonus aethiopoides TaxID=144406 RepID=A0AA39KL35_9HYME|nr:hypothetical protein PV328_003861 [Microctonus aethiopoides]